MKKILSTTLSVVEILRTALSNLLILIQSVYSLSIRCVPVVQRIEQGFPKTKLAFHQISSAIVLTAQATLLLVACTGSFVISVIRSLRIFLQPGDTKGDPTLSTVFVAVSL